MKYTAKDFRGVMKFFDDEFEGMPRVVLAALRIAFRVMEPGFLEAHHWQYSGVPLEPENQREIDAIRNALTDPPEEKA